MTGGTSPEFARTRTAGELARLTRQPPSRIAALLAEDVRRGIVEKVGDGYRLTAAAERRHGRDLRGIGDEP